MLSRINAKAMRRADARHASTGFADPRRPLAPLWSGEITPTAPAAVRRNRRRPLPDAVGTRAPRDGGV